MSRTGKILEAATNMVKCKKAIKTLYGSDWKSRLDPYKDLIRKKMEADAKEEIEAAIDICRDAGQLGTNGLILHIMAAAVDMVEPE